MIQTITTLLICIGLVLLLWMLIDDFFLRRRDKGETDGKIKRSKDEESQHSHLPAEDIKEKRARDRAFKKEHWRQKTEAHPFCWAALEKLYLYPVLTFQVFLSVFSLSAVMSAMLGYTIQKTLMPDDETERKIVFLLFLTLVIFLFGCRIVTSGRVAPSLEYTVIKNSKTATAVSVLSLLAVLIFAIYSGIWFVYELFFYWVKQKNLLSLGTFILTLIASKITPKALEIHAYGILPFSGVAVEPGFVTGRETDLFKCPVCGSEIRRITLESSGIAERKARDEE